MGLTNIFSFTGLGGGSIGADGSENFFSDILYCRFCFAGLFRHFYSGKFFCRISFCRRLAPAIRLPAFLFAGIHFADFFAD